MQRTLAVTLVVAVSACASTRDHCSIARPIEATVAAAGLIAGAAEFHVASKPSSGANAGYDRLWGGLFVGASVVVAVGALAGVGSCHDDTVTNADLARQLTSAARSRARTGDCTGVETIAARVRRIDSSYYADVFVHDEAIVNRCLTAYLSAEAADYKAAERQLQREFVEPAEPATRSSTMAPLPERLDPAMIAAAVAKVRPQVSSCRDRSPVNGQVLVTVQVAADGSVITVAVTSTPDPALGNCVVGAVQGATFAKTQRGGSFRYPFVF